MKKAILFVLIVFFLPAAGFTQETSEPTPSPTSSPAPTCAPCVDTIEIYYPSYSDNFGNYTDNDGYPDPGEIIGITVRGYSHDQCCFTDGNPSINISTDYQYVEYIGKSNPGSVWGTYFYYIKPGAPCSGTADFHIQGEAGSGYDYELLSVPIGVDDDGVGGFICDTKYNSSTPPISPIILEPENADMVFGTNSQSGYIESCDNEDWIAFSNVDFGPGIYYKTLTARLAATGNTQTGTIELRLERPDGVLIGSLDVIGTGSVLTYADRTVLINAFSGIHDLYLVFKNGQDICRLDSVTLGPEPPLPYWNPPGPEITPGPIPTPGPTIDPSTPLADYTIEGSLCGIADSRAIEVKNNTAYTGFVDEYNTNNSGILIIDVSVPDNPVPLSMIPLSGRITDIKAQDNFLFVADTYSGIHIIDITDNYQPQIIATYPCSPGSYSHIAVHGNTLYCATAHNDLLIIDITNKAQPVLLSTFTDDKYIQNISVDGNIAYVTINSGTYTPYANGIVVLDISDKTNPVPLQSVTTLRSSGIAQSGNYLYCGLEIAGRNDGALQVYDITTRTNPVQTGEIRLLGSYSELKVRNNYVYCANFSYGLYVIDVRDSTNPALYTICDRNNPDLAIDTQGFLYTIGAGKMQIISIDIPGDVNGDGTVDIVDALLAAQYYVGLDPPNFNADAADVNCDGTVDIVDALIIAQFYVGLISQLDYCVTPTPAPATATPTPASETATPTSTATPYPKNITVRAKGVVGDESVSLLVNDIVVETWTMSTSFQDYSGEGSGNIKVEFTNDDGGDRDVQVDCIIVDGVTLKAEDQAINTGVYQNDSCGGSYSEMLNCNGYIDFGDIDPTTIGIHTYEWLTNISIDGGGIASASSEYSDNYLAENALDNNSSTKWNTAYHIPEPHWLLIDLENSHNTIGAVEILHAGSEYQKYITKDYKIETSNNLENWTTQVNIVGNISNNPYHNFSSYVEARYVRFYITNAGEMYARIYKVNVYGY